MPGCVAEATRPLASPSSGTFTRATSSGAPHASQGPCGSGSGSGAGVQATSARASSRYSIAGLFAIRRPDVAIARPRQRGELAAGAGDLERALHDGHREILAGRLLQLAQA